MKLKNILILISIINMFFVIKVKSKDRLHLMRLKK